MLRVLIGPTSGKPTQDQYNTNCQKLFQVNL